MRFFLASILYLSIKCFTMTYKVICPVRDNQVIITLPPDFKGKKEVTIYINDSTDLKNQKLEVLKLAAKDPLFTADIHEISQDFDSIDSETL